MFIQILNRSWLSHVFSLPFDLSCSSSQLNHFLNHCHEMSDEVIYWTNRVQHLTTQLRRSSSGGYGHYAQQHREALKQLKYARHDHWYECLLEGPPGYLDFHGMSYQFVEWYLDDLLHHHWNPHDPTRYRLVTGVGGGKLRKLVMKMMDQRDHQYHETRSGSFLVTIPRKS